MIILLIRVIYYGDFMDLKEKLIILSDAAKYDASCSSSGSRRDDKGKLANTAYSGICHSYSSDGRCVSLLKILLTNCCIYDCKYCVNKPKPSEISEIGSQDRNGSKTREKE